MKPHTSTNDAKPVTASYALPPELTAAVATLNEALERRKRLDVATDAAPAQIESITQEIAHLRNQLGHEQTQAALAERGSDDEIKHLQKADKTRLSFELGQREVDAARIRLDALEAAAPEIDGAITSAGTGLNREVQMFGNQYRADIADELRELALPLRTTLARAHAVGGGLFDVGCDAYLADPLDFMCFGRADYRGENLLDLRGAPGAENDPLVLALQPVREALVALRRHRSYLPLAQRPAPYVIKGSNFPGDRAAPPLPQPAPPPPMKQTFEEALRQPYEVRGDSGGRTCNAGAVDLNVGAQLVNNLMRD